MKLYEYDEALESMYRAADSASGVDAETGMVFDFSQLDAWEKARGEKRFETKRVRATLKVTAANKLVITDKAAIPAQYLKTKMESDDAAIKEALKAGEHVPGAMLADSVSLAVK